jgi:hypothetical protein
MRYAASVSTNTVAAQRAASFAAWCQSPAPHALGLDPEIVGFICRLMQRPEMHGITGIGVLGKTLQVNRTKLIFTTDAEWHGVMLSARVLWQAYQKWGRS